LSVEFEEGEGGEEVGEEFYFAFLEFRFLADLSYRVPLAVFEHLKCVVDMFVQEGGTIIVFQLCGLK